MCENYTHGRVAKLVGFCILQITPMRLTRAKRPGTQGAFSISGKKRKLSILARRPDNTFQYFSSSERHIHERSCMYSSEKLCVFFFLLNEVRWDNKQSLSHLRRLRCRLDLCLPRRTSLALTHLYTLETHHLLFSTAEKHEMGRIEQELFFSLRV